MAKKKAESNQQTPQTQPVSETDAHDATQHDGAPTPQTSEDTHVQTELAAGHESTGELPVVDPPPTITSEIDVQDGYRDEQMMSRLRSQILSPTESYREAQIFQAQGFDVGAILLSQEPVLIQNTLEILDKLDLWQPEVMACLTDDVAQTRESAQKYILKQIRKSPETCDILVDAIAKKLTESPSGSASHNAMLAFSDRFRQNLLLLLIQAKEEDASLIEASLIRLMPALGMKSVLHMLYDASPRVRVAVIRYLSTLPTIHIEALAAALILLKDNDEEVNTALLRMFGKFAAFSELVVPQVLEYMARPGAQTKEAREALKRYGDAMVAPVMSALGNPNDAVAHAVAQVIATAPQRFTDALIAAIQSFLTRPHIKDRIRTILARHDDPLRSDDIISAMKGHIPPPRPEVPSPPVIIPGPVVDDPAFYRENLPNDVLLGIAKKLDDAGLEKLLGDASDAARINAMRIIQIHGQASHALIMTITVWMKSANFDLALVALDTYIACYPNPEPQNLETILKSLRHSENVDIREHFFLKMAGNQNYIRVLLQLYVQDPRKFSPLVTRLLNLHPSQETFQALFTCLDEDKSPGCIAQTLQLLDTIPSKPDLRSIRRRVQSLIDNPPSQNEYGVMIRRHGLSVLGRILPSLDKDTQEAIEFLKDFYKKTTRFDLKDLAASILRRAGEEVFDFDDEDDFDEFKD